MKKLPTELLAGSVIVGLDGGDGGGDSFPAIDFVVVLTLIVSVRLFQASRIKKERTKESGATTKRESCFRLMSESQTNMKSRRSAIFS